MQRLRIRETSILHVTPPGWFPSRFLISMLRPELTRYLCCLQRLQRIGNALAQPLPSCRFEYFRQRRHAACASIWPPRDCRGTKIPLIPPVRMSGQIVIFFRPAFRRASEHAIPAISRVGRSYCRLAQLPRSATGTLQRAGQRNRRHPGPACLRRRPARCRQRCQTRPRQKRL